MTEKYLMLSLEDEKTKEIAEIINNKTARKILKTLADKEASESDIAEELKIPINTIEYNLNKLVRAGLAEKTKNFFWSKKGKRIEMYKLANKSVLISTKPKLISSIIGVAGITALSAYIISIFTRTQIAVKSEFVDKAVTSVPETASAGLNAISYFSGFPVWMWFLFGAWLALIIFLIWNWRKL